MNETVWPFSGLPYPTPFEQDPETITAFVLSPFQGNEFDVAFKCCFRALKAVTGRYGLKANLKRSDFLFKQGVIHQDIWAWISEADIVIADITGANPNVMMELGVAAAWRDSRQVIILRQKKDETRWPFDIQPLRAILYDVTTADGLWELEGSLSLALDSALNSLPFRRMEVRRYEAVLPFEYPGHDQYLLTSPLAHRHIRQDKGLEFGSAHAFRHSWARPYTGELADVHVSATMMMLPPFQDVQREIPWIGIKLCSTGFLMNYGLGCVVRRNRTVQLTYMDKGGNYHDPPFSDELSQDPSAIPVTIDTRLDKERWVGTISQGGIEIIKWDHNLLTLTGHRPAGGEVLLQTFLCRGVLASLRIEGTPFNT